MRAIKRANLSLATTQVLASLTTKVSAAANILDEPFSFVLGWVVSYAQQKNASLLLGPTIPSIILKHNVASWLP